MTGEGPYRGPASKTYRARERGGRGMDKRRPPRGALVAQVDDDDDIFDRSATLRHSRKLTLFCIDRRPPPLLQRTPLLPVVRPFCGPQKDARHPT